MQSWTSLEAINEHFIKSIQCDLIKTAKQPVPGEGNPTAQILFIGEAPGVVEDKTGRPFVGPAGKFLNVMLESIGMQREDVFITNTVKYRPPENRDPTDEEKELFQPWLDAQIEFIKPKVFVPLGRHALWKFLPGVSISRVHGKLFKRKEDNRVVFAMYHPAVALYNGSFRKVLLDDFQNLKKFLDGAKNAATVEDAIAADAAESDVVKKAQKILKESAETKAKSKKDGEAQQSMF